MYLNELQHEKTNRINRNKSHLDNIINSINSIFTFTDGMSKEDFFKDEKVYSAVMYKLLIIGYSSHALIKNKNFEKSFSNKINLRTFARFEQLGTGTYFSANKELVYNTIIKDLTVLKEEIEKKKLQDGK